MKITKIIGLSLLATSIFVVSSCSASLPNEKEEEKEEVGGDTDIDTDGDTDIGTGGDTDIGTGGDDSSEPGDEQVNTKVSITKIEGHMESAYLTWDKLSTASSYNVYYKSENSSSFKKIDTTLIREYETYYRADIVGLSSGKYDIKVHAVVGSEEQTTYSTGKVDVSNHDRSGFAFSNNADASGAYKSDGTLKDNAQVIYVTKNNAKTVEATIGGNKVRGFQSILDAKQKKGNTDIVNIRIVGEIELSDLDHISSSEEGIQIKGASDYQNMNLTIEGIGSDATINGFGFLIRNCSNVEIRNLGIINFMDDGISVDTNNKNLWLHNNDFFYGNPGGDSDQAKGDGSLDIKKSQYITVSYNHFWDSGKSCLVDATKATTGGANYLTYHHNWFDHSDSRHPRVRNASAIHIYNNYFDGNSKYGIGASVGSSIFSEANYYRNVKYPMLTSLQGSDIGSDGEGTFSGENGGFIKSYNDIISGGTFIPYSDTNKVDFDAYVASSRDEAISSTITSKVGNQAYSNFDTDQNMYHYTITPAENVEANVSEFAGRINGGDLTYTFNNETADTSYDIDPTLKALVTNYKTSLVYIQGEKKEEPLTALEVIALINALPEASNITLENKISILEAKAKYDSLETKEKEKVTNYTKLLSSIEALESIPLGTQILTFDTGSAGDNEFFTVSGKLLSNAPSLTYNETIYTSALKFEKDTTISFSATESFKITIVTDKANKGIKINGNKYKTDESGILVLENLDFGDIILTKGDSMNVYVIIVE